MKYEVLPAMNQSTHSETTSERLVMEETSTIRALHEKFNATRIEGVSLSVLYSYKPFYVSKPTEKGKRIMPVY